MTGIVMNELERFLFSQEVRGLVGEFCPLPISEQAKKRAIIAGLRAYEPLILVTSMQFVAGRVVNVKVDHPRVGEITVAL